MLADVSLSISCPECQCPITVPLSRVIHQAGAFCPACQVHIAFADDRAGVAAADRALHILAQQLSQTFAIELKF